MMESMAKQDDNKSYNAELTDEEHHTKDGGCQRSKAIDVKIEALLEHMSASHGGRASEDVPAAQDQLVSVPPAIAR